MAQLAQAFGKRISIGISIGQTRMPMRKDFSNIGLGNCSFGARSSFFFWRHLILHVLNCNSRRAGSMLTLY
ncbi:hypothetical protein DUNSADRAFT_2250 [Dunaliella salina]|uniref:Encoded protein n=1 Tax=Dunaliella salina TaxID=3046 RepID=A0ABQ7GVY8_DUNSA|nr:hypothetical protein DUNSADRAFT_2250 [Dunaliella salina]|eukprot:KAF5838787.1 hypothetical protein DUNSADRAFT_2250 [Dunaliella salina]